VFGTPFLIESPRWTARFKGREEAVKQLAKLRGLSEGHEYVLEEVYRILDQIEQERRAAGGKKGWGAEVREMVMPGNRKRIAIGGLMFVFMQFAGVMLSM